MSKTPEQIAEYMRQRNLRKNKAKADAEEDKIRETEATKLKTKFAVSLSKDLTGKFVVEKLSVSVADNAVLSQETVFAADDRAEAVERLKILMVKTFLQDEIQ